MTYNYYSKFERSSLKSTTLKNIYQSGAAVAQRVHIPKVVGSNPTSGTKGKAKIPINKCAAYQPKIIYKN